MNKKWIISTVAASLLMGTLSLSANTDMGTQTPQKVLRIQKSINHEAKIQKEHFKEASKEITDGLKKSFLAARSLENHHLDEAKKSLKASISLLESALKAEPKLGLVPIAQEIDVHVFGGDANTLQAYLDTTVEMLKKHNTQEARMRLMPLEDDMIIATQQLPINDYLVSSKATLKSLEANKPDEALATLVTGMSLMQVETVIMPIPLMVAEDLILDASALDKSKKEEAQKLLSMAQDELKKAVLLGYTQKYAPEYKALSEGISEIQKEIDGKNIVAKFYDRLKESFHTLIGKSREDVIREKAEKNVQNYQHHEAKKAVLETSKFDQDAKSDEAKTIK